MAGFPFSISTTKQRENHERGSQIFVATDQWQVEYARFISCRSSDYSSTHPSLTALRKNHLRRTWIPADDASVTIIYQRSSGGKYSAVLVVSLKSKIVEVHYISKMHFSWPQISSTSEFPARGSKAVFLSYKDSVGQVYMQMHKFALRFSAIDETEKFMNVVKKMMENGSPPLHQCCELNSEMSSIADAISSHIPTSKSNRDSEEQFTQSTDNTTQLMPLSSSLESQDSEPQEGLADGVAANADPFFPPSFTQLMNSYCPAVSEDRSPSPTIPFNPSLADYLGVATKTDSGDLQNQFLQYLEKTSFKDLLASVEDVISLLGDDMLL